MDNAHERVQIQTVKELREAFESAPFEAIRIALTYGRDEAVEKVNLWTRRCDALLTELEHSVSMEAEETQRA